MKVLVAQINPIVGDIPENKRKIIAALEKGKAQGVELVLFPEMAICGYPPEDLLLLPSFLEAAESALRELMPHTKGLTAVIGAIRKNPELHEKPLLNTAAVFENGKLLGFQDKRLLPEYDVFTERRYFEPGKEIWLWDLCGEKVAITICEDIWQHGGELIFSHYRQDPVSELSQLKPTLHLNLSASPFYVERHRIREKVAAKVARTGNCPFILCNQVGANDGLIFDGKSACVDQEGNLFARGKGFEEDLFLVDTVQKRGPISKEMGDIANLESALVLGLHDYFSKLKFKKAVLGLSGGIDSAVVLALAVKALGKENVLSLFMPSQFTSEQSREDATALAKNLGVKLRVLSIEPSFSTVMGTLQPHFNDHTPGIMEENLQSRLRGLLLMAFSNKEGYLVLTTGNKSEMAMGYMTLYGDMCGAIAPLGDVSKGLVYELAHWINRDLELIPKAIIDRPPTAELKPNQLDSDTLPDYAILDAVLKEYVEEHRSIQEIASRLHVEVDLVATLVKKIHQNEYKRRQAPPSLRVTKKAFTVGRRFPIVEQWGVNNASK